MVDIVEIYVDIWTWNGNAVLFYVTYGCYLGEGEVHIAKKGQKMPVAAKRQHNNYLTTSNDQILTLITENNW